MPDTSSTSKSKKTKSFPSCATCRKHKTRCEILDLFDENTPVKCHRCKVVKIECTYSQMDKNTFRSYFLPPSAQAGNEGSSSYSYYDGQPYVYPLCLPSSSSFTDSTIDPDMLVSYEYVVSRFKAQLDPAKLPPFFSFLHWQKGIEWGAPLEAIREMFYNASTKVVPPEFLRDRSLSDIVSRQQVDVLLNIFLTIYAPWLNIVLEEDLQDRDSFLCLVCCTLASRHFERATQTLITLRLQRLTEEWLVKLYLHSNFGSQCMPTVKALLILSLWSPVYDGTESSGIKDGRLLIASAVSMALNNLLNEAPAKVVELRSSLTSQVVPETHRMQDLMDQARLWTSVLNAEALLSLGTGRALLGKSSDEDTLFIPLEITHKATSRECQDMRIRLSRELFTVVENAITLNLTSTSSDELDAWYRSMSHSLEALDRLGRLALPLEIVTNQDQFWFQMLLFQISACRLICVYRAITNLHRVYGSSQTEVPWYTRARPRGINVVVIWGIETLQLSECLLTHFLKSDKRLVATCPDSIFQMVGFAATMLIGHKLLISMKHGLEIDGSGDQLLAKSYRFCSEIALSDQHPAKKCAHLMGTLVVKWQRFKAGVDSEKGSPTSWNQPSEHSRTEALFSVSDGVYDHDITQHLQARSASVLKATDCDLWSMLSGSNQPPPGSFLSGLSNL